MKRIVSVTLCLLLVLGFCVPALAAETAEEKMLLAIKERIAATDEYEEFNSSVRDENGNKMFSFSWSGQQKGLSLDVNEEGVIVSYRKYDWGEQEGRKPYFQRPSAEELTDRANRLFSQLNPDVTVQLTLDSDRLELYSDETLFRVQRIENGIEVIGDSGTLTVDNQGTEIRSMYVTYTTGLTFDASEPKLSKTEAQKAYEKQLTPKLFYLYHMEEDKPSFLLAYRLQDFDQYIAADNGEIVRPNDTQEKYNGLADEAGGGSANSEAAVTAKLTEEEIKHLEEVEGLLSQKSLEQAVRKLSSVLSITPEYQPVRFNRYPGSDGKYSAFMTFKKNEDSMITVSLDAKSGAIQHYADDQSAWNEDKQTKPSPEQLEKAFASLSDRAGEYQYDEASNRFIRYANHIPVERDDAILFFNQNDKVCYYYISYTDLEFPSSDGALSPEEITAKLFEQVDYQVRYLPIDQQARLVYALSDRPGYLDAMTGKLPVPAEQEPIISEYSDITGHYAEAAANELARFGIGFAGGKLLPEQTITVGEFAQLLHQTFYGDFDVLPMAKAIRWAYSGEEKLPDEQEALTRQRAAVLLVNAMGYGEVAKLSSIYRSPFTDVNEEIGAIAILSGMGILNGNGDGTFSPGQAMTRGETIMLLYRYLSQK